MSKAFIGPSDPRICDQVHKPTIIVRKLWTSIAHSAQLLTGPPTASLQSACMQARNRLACCSSKIQPRSIAAKTAWLLCRFSLRNRCKRTNCLMRLKEKHGHTVIVANNGKEATQAIAAQRFDLVLMDVQMPEMDGLEATAVIRRMEESTSRHTPIVAMTSHAMQGLIVTRGKESPYGFPVSGLTEEGPVVP